MITDLNALKAYTAYRAHKIPRLKIRLLLESPGCDQNEINRIKNALPNMPESYLKCVQDIHLNGISIGYFHLSPPGLEINDFAEKLLQINTAERNPFWNIMSEKGLYQIANWEAEPVCIATKDSSYSEGAVLKLSIGQPSPKEALLANSFEHFLLIAGNLDAIRDKHSATPDKAKALTELEDCLQYFPLSAEAVTAWKNISAAVLQL